MAHSLRLLRVVLCLFTSLLCARALNNTKSTRTHDVTAVVLDNKATFGVCMYPTSGTYSFLARLLYYCTLVFSLFSRAHLWLVAGALVSALVYSGSAAVHACLLVWRGPNSFSDNDSLALYAILSSACLVTVPLLNWSGTLRRLGQKAASIKDPKALNINGDVGTRTVVIYWAFLVLIGFICIWQQVLTSTPPDGSEYPDMSKVMCRPGTNASKLLSSDGTFYRRAIDRNFIQDNGCTDPCNQITGLPSIFRSQDDLVLYPRSQALLHDGLTVSMNAKTMRFLSLTIKNFVLNFLTLPLIVLQGFITALFGRRDPREIRDLIYIVLSMEHPISSKRYIVRTQEVLVRMFAGLNYLIACAVVIFCVPFFITSVIGLEFVLWDYRHDAEKPYMIGQWSSWASAILVVLAALIAKYHDDVVNILVKGCRRAGHGVKSYFSRTHKQREYEAEHGFAAMNDETSSLFSTSVIKSECRTHSLKELPFRTSSSPPNTQNTAPNDILNALTHLYKSISNPLNQTGKGPIDELHNFYRWCKNPQEVSRRVIRRPIRHRDTEYLDAPPAVVDASKDDLRAQD
ncbi:hypothetical protein N7G274_005322 [Stereocaulon virgatum]|uniref:Uncharacterized protein n=1 Tax=Stereocaulon virgatum TaxID=373712 RepID=A0ABR4A8C3_9LECA